MSEFLISKIDVEKIKEIDFEKIKELLDKNKQKMLEEYYYIEHGRQIPKTLEQRIEEAKRMIKKYER